LDRSIFYNVNYINEQSKSFEIDRMTFIILERATQHALNFYQKYCRLDGDNNNFVFDSTYLHPDKFMEISNDSPQQLDKGSFKSDFHTGPSSTTKFTNEEENSFIF